MATMPRVSRAERPASEETKSTFSRGKDSRRGGSVTMQDAVELSACTETGKIGLGRELLGGTPRLLC